MRCLRRDSAMETITIRGHLEMEKKRSKLQYNEKYTSTCVTLKQHNYLKANLLQEDLPGGNRKMRQMVCLDFYSLNII